MSDIRTTIVQNNNGISTTIADDNNVRSNVISLGLTPALIGLGNVDNTSDTAKPISIAQQAALNLKANLAGATFTGAISATNLSGTNTGDQDLSGLVPKSTTVNGHALSANVTVTKSDVGLSNVDNTSDVNKPVSSATATALGLKANIANPIFTGSVTLPRDPTAALEAATKEYVDNLASGIVAKPSVLFATSGTLDATYTNGVDGVGAKLTSNVDGALTGIGVDGISIGTGVLVKNQTSKAQNGRYFVSNLGSPSTRWVLTRCGLCDEADEIPGAYIFVQDGAFKGSGYVLVVADPPTFVVGVDNIDVFQFSGAGTYTASNGVALNDNQFSADNTIARLDGPTFTGVPSAPTATADTNTTQIATTAYAKKEADDAQAAAVQRANHTGTQDVSTITGLSTVATSGSYTDLSNKPTPSDIDAADEVLVSATPPVSPLNQQRWFNTNSGVEYVWVASQNVWVGTVAADSQPVSPSAIGAVAPGDNTVFTGQLTAPLQTAATASALMIRSLVNSEFIKNVGREYNLSIAANVSANGGTNFSSVGTFYQIRIASGSSLSGLARSSFNCNLMADYGSGSGFNRTIPFTLAIALRMRATGSNHTQTVFGIGIPATTAAYGANITSVRGIGFRAYYSVANLRTELVMWAHDGTNYLESSAIVIPFSSFFIQNLAIVWDGAGTYSLYSSGTTSNHESPRISTVPIGTMTGLGSASFWGEASNTNGIALYVNNSATNTPSIQSLADALQIRMMIGQSLN